MKGNQSLRLPIAVILSLILAISFSCNTPSNTVAGLSLDTLELADQLMQSYVDEGKLPCVSIMIIKDGQTAHQHTFGLANIEENRALEEDAIFRIYSMSKPITAAALMMLYDEGKFQLDDPVKNYIPEFASTKVWVEGEEVDQQEDFTIRQMLLNGGELNGVRVLEESTVKMIMSDQMPSTTTYGEGMGYGLGGQVNLETGEYGWTGMASTFFVADPKNDMVGLAFTQYIPHMGVPFATEYWELVRKALVE